MKRLADLLGPTWTCIDCGEEKALEDFPFRTRESGERRQPCRKCKARRWSSGRKSSRCDRKHKLKVKYGLTLDEFDQMSESQEGKCLICGESKEPLQVDHDHKSGKVRGLLCHKCNKALGLLGDDPDRMRQAASYLESNETVI